MAKQLDSSFLKNPPAGTPEIAYSLTPDSGSGVGKATPEHPLLITRHLSRCNAMLLENTDTGETHLFHFSQSILTRGQKQALLSLQQEGGHYRAVTICGGGSFDPQERIPYYIDDTDMEYFTLRSSLNRILGHYLPGIEWHEEIVVPFAGFSVGYDTATRSLHIEDAQIEKPKPYRTLPHYDYGDPFTLTKLRPAAQVEPEGATILTDYRGRAVT